MTETDEFDPLPGVPQTLGPGLRRILAPNPSPMTFRGTNTYLIGQSHLAVIDPGPADETHLQAILSALTRGQRITHILVTHAHLDHSPLAAALSARTGAPVYAFGDARAGRSVLMQTLAQSGLIAGGEGVDHDFAPDVALEDGAVLGGPDWTLTALWTPGHFGNHLCFSDGDRIFSGDLVMGWASSLVSPPDGDLTDFMASCRRLRGLAPARLLPGHGAPVEDPAARLDWLIGHRQGRESAILARLGHGPATAAEIAADIYTDTPATLMPAATRNVLAHLIDLKAKKMAAPQGPLHAGTPFGLT